MEELELTYLAKYLPANLLKSPSREITDVYFPNTAVHPVLRLRKAGEKYELTKKEPINAGDASHQRETTIPLSESEYQAFARLEGKQTRKVRYYYSNNGTTFEIDVFQDGLAGLVTVDVEFSSIREKSEFRPPDFCLIEVTQEDFIAGGMVCGKQYADIQPKLDTFGYTRIG